ncbi:hypothetical protein [Levilactobacillus mulengensis]|uniref:hypothetical protein n=1 Tax=Levilactobacillus mulengensis TaxID=2486025 RepID=UPI001CDCD8AB|nr:hypothetical protein [Levilactobacillus mulengensis]
MNKVKLAQGVIALVASAGMFGFMTTTASANSQYSAARSNSVKLVWRKSMKQHMYTATKGARYSKHLGIRYSNNDVTPTVTWYTDAHEKLYKKYKGHSAIYYHVKSADGTLQGWIWRGYLRKVVSTNTTIAKNAIINLGSGAKPDAQSMQIAKNILNQLLSSKVHFRTQAEVFPNVPEKSNDRDIVLRDPSADSSTPSAKLMFNLLKENRINGSGFGVGKASTTLLIQNKINVGDTLHSYFDPSSDFYGQQGLTRKNFFTDVKIGVAVTKTADGRMAVLAVFQYPDKYTKLTSD